MKLRAALVTAVLIAPLAITGTAAHADPNNNSVRKLVKAVNGKNVKRHLKVLDLIAKANGNTRVDGTRGYELSRDYVAGLLRLAGYKVSTQKFTFENLEFKTKPVFERRSPSPQVFALGLDWTPSGHTAEGTFSGKVQAVDVMIPPGPAPNSSTSGCEAADFAGFTPGNFALIQRGTCGFSVKVANAKAAGASGVVLFNEGQEGRTEADVNPDLGGPSDLPVLFASYWTGRDLAATPGAEVGFTFSWETVTKSYTTYNVLAETRHGRDDNVVMVGGHLDSVEDGPGINDNGSGVGAILEVALQMAKSRPENKVRFAFWGGEEFGLLGAEHYVANLTEQERANIALYLNFDMVASPNYVYHVYDGDDSDGVGAGPGPEGSAQIEKYFEEFYASRGLASKGTDFDGRSDYGPFIAVGIPAGGLFTGAEKRKTPEEVAKWGGTAGERYDRCYHQACDDIRNINDTALDVNADAIATLVGTYAFDPSKINGPHSPGVGVRAKLVDEAPSSQS
ncbi:M28 family metallopeptidase [Nonomuraea dietziae]|uniref:Aminopeptidase Y n=1 Tax=Nonomuraea dietziae TaxID=65515 RepID=A0A7W5V425_9ACTN|nr:M28 family metallopeptidase [Nonomuraea dietziae]MBB3730167.1 aminopeptidase Y [Nonomuraea dietziae]